MLYNMCHVMLYDICSGQKQIDQNMLYITCAMLCYITCVMLCDITRVMLCYITCFMLCYITYVMLCHITYVMLCYIPLCHVMLYDMFRTEHVI